MKRTFHTARKISDFLLSKKIKFIGLLCFIGATTLQNAQGQNDPLQTYKGKIGKTLSETQQS